MIAGIMAGVSVGASLLGMAGSFMASKEQEKVAKYNAKVARNKGLAQYEAMMAQSAIQRDVDREDLSTIRNTLANRGIESGVGSPLLVASKAFADTQADQNEMQRQAVIAKMTGEQQGFMYNRQAKSIRSSRAISLLSQAAGGAAGAASTYQSFK